MFETIGETHCKATTHNTGAWPIRWIAQTGQRARDVSWEINWRTHYGKTFATEREAFEHAKSLASATTV